MSTIKSSSEDLTLNADGSNEVKFQINAVEKASINSSGLFTSTTIDATALTGNLPAISGASLTSLPAHTGNVAFPATQVASADANTLDDYQEGTWSPLLTDGSNNATMTATSGAYTKIGDVCVLEAIVHTSSIGSMTGVAIISGIPFQAASATDRALTVCNVNNFNITAGESVQADILASGTTIRLRLSDSTLGSTNLDPAEWSDDGFLIIGGCYKIA